MKSRLWQFSATVLGTLALAATAGATNGSSVVPHPAAHPVGQAPPATGGSAAATPMQSHSVTDAANITRLLETLRKLLGTGNSIQKEIESDYPTIGKFLTDDYKARLKRELRAAKATNQDFYPWPPTEGVIWKAKEIIARDASSISWMTGIVDFENGEETGGGYNAAFIFSLQGNLWLISGHKLLGQDRADDE